MPTISLTTFVDFSRKGGGARYTHVRKAIDEYAAEYVPAHDFYKPLREAICEMHAGGHPMRFLDTTVNGLRDQKKLTNYPDAVAGYKRWWGRKRWQWVKPPRGTWSAQGLDVRVNPELGFRTPTGDKIAVKLHFKAEPVTKRQLDATLHLMAVSMPNTQHPWTPAVLDVREGRLIQPTNPVRGINHVLASEAAAFMALWRSLNGPA